MTSSMESAPPMAANKVRRVDFHPDEWIGGTLGMTLEEEGLFARLTARYYSRGGPLPSDLNELAALCAVRPQVMRRLWAKLAPKYDETDGKLVSNRCETELKAARNRAESARFSAGERWKNKDLPDAGGNAPGTANQEPRTKNNKERGFFGNGSGTPQAGADEPWLQRMAGWNKSKFWLADYGPKPGENGCKVPKEFFTEEVAA
jgi:uncharacterized protein YdaU (DUF1376 family)